MKKLNKELSFENLDFTDSVESVLFDEYESIKNNVNNLKSDVNNSVNNSFGNYISNESYDIKTPISSIAGGITITDDDAKEIAESIYKAKTVVNDNGASNINNITNSISSTIENGYSSVISAADKISKAIEEGSKWLNDNINSFSEAILTFSNYISTDSSLGQAINSIVNVTSQNLLDYKDGVTETSFGMYQSDSWKGRGPEKSFLDHFKAINSGSISDSIKVNFLKSTPLDSGATREALYGNLMLGCPFLFNNLADPANRTLINTIIKDSKYLSLVPGMPKYNGSQYLQSDRNNIYKQTQSPTSMMNYLLRNGLDKDFSEKDKRYYTFEAKYSEYYAYLETMLNTIWVKLGLAGTNGNFNLFTFFNITNEDITDYNTPKSQYMSPIGFYINPTAVVTESVDSSITNIGGDLANNVNSAADAYKQINYITGMGTGSSYQNLNRKVAIGLQSASNAANYLSNNLRSAFSMGSAFKGNSNGVVGGLKYLSGFALGAARDVNRISTTEDFGSVIQSFATANGMNVVYPELWQSSGYTKGITLNFSFISPYGDAYSIFKYVYVPLCSLLCFSLPRQAAENGFVSPFFVRADIPGIVTSDLALISNITWTKGGSSNLWTKDGLPRAIDVSLNITDLYPFLAMSKRLSFLSANPSYTVFLDNMAGLRVKTDPSDEDSINTYFKELISRVSGTDNKGNIVWNSFSHSKINEVNKSIESKKSSFSKGIDFSAIPWLHNSSI